MLTIHCYHCGVDEVLSGVPGTASSPLPLYRSKHHHGMTGRQHCKLVCPCGQTFEIDTREMDRKAIEAHIDTCFEWSKGHVGHMRQAEAQPPGTVN